MQHRGNNQLEHRLLAKPVDVWSITADVQKNTSSSVNIRIFKDFGQSSYSQFCYSLALKQENYFKNFYWV